MESLLERLVVEIADEPDETVDDPFVSSSDEESSGSAWFGPSWGQRCFGIVGYVQSLHPNSKDSETSNLFVVG